MSDNSSTIRQNNLQWCREKAQTCSLSAGFCYGVLDHGTALGEKLWRDKQQQRPPHSGFDLQPIEPQSRIRSLQDVQNLIDSASRSYQQSLQQPPPRPSAPSSTHVSQNAPQAHQPPPRPNNSSLSSHATVSDQNRPPQQSHSANGPQAHPPPQLPSDVFGDDFDALLADFDVDSLVAQQQQQQHQQQGHSRAYSFNDNFDCRGSSTANTYGSHSAATTGSAIANIHNNAFDYGSQWSNQAEVSINTRSYEEPSSYSSNNYGSSAGSNQDAPPSNYGSGSFVHASELSRSTGNYDSSLASSIAPLCPGHGLPCSSLTARSAANSGRRFYKCSLPEGQQCDFFEWADGNQQQQQQTTTYENHAASYATANASSGMVKDLVRENRFKFGHQGFRPGQEEVIRNAMQGRDVFVLMPTGGGKSLCYQLPAWCAPGLTVVVSPLLSLIQDQVQSLTKLGVKAVYMASNNHAEAQNIAQQIHATEAHDGVKLLYLTPEKINHSNQMRSILGRLYSKNLISRFVVDEAHCKYMQDFVSSDAKGGRLNTFSLLPHQV
jgi:hypothetical protein